MERTSFLTRLKWGSSKFYVQWLDCWKNNVFLWHHSRLSNWLIDIISDILYEIKTNTILCQNKNICKFSYTASNFTINIVQVKTVKCKIVNKIYYYYFLFQQKCFSKGVIKIYLFGGGYSDNLQNDYRLFLFRSGIFYHQG